MVADCGASYAKKVGQEGPMGVVKVEIPVAQETADALADPRKREAVGRLVDRLVHPAEGDDPLIALLEKTSREAAVARMTQQAIDAELMALKVERGAVQP